MRAEAWRLVVGYVQVLIFLLSCCFFITLDVPNRYEVRDFQLDLVELAPAAAPSENRYRP